MSILGDKIRALSDTHPDQDMAFHMAIGMAGHLVDIEAATTPIADAEPAAGVKVKPLVWTYDDRAKAWRSDAAVTNDIYLIWEEETEWVLQKRGSANCSFGAMDMVKAAAQADYEARILAAVETGPMTLADALELPEIKALISAGWMFIHGYAYEDDRTLKAFYNMKDALANLKGKP